ncbi:DivIVA domain-containing protein [Spirillospora sp. NPDC029432]|uniref:DivIVA domain-containing protein n=1 Tax=Spirillospora sp. NPDC029432 TaxID=3154599 RepID=UPI003452D429
MIRKSSGSSRSSRGSNKWNLTKVMRGYDPKAVDAYLALLESGAAPPPAGFRLVMRGYDPAQVNALIAEMTHGTATP